MVITIIALQELLIQFTTKVLKLPQLFIFLKLIKSYNRHAEDTKSGNESFPSINLEIVARKRRAFRLHRAVVKKSNIIIITFLTSFWETLQLFRHNLWLQGNTRDDTTKSIPLPTILNVNNYYNIRWDRLGDYSMCLKWKQSRHQKFNIKLLLFINNDKMNLGWCTWVFPWFPQIEVICLRRIVLVSKLHLHKEKKFIKNVFDGLEIFHCSRNFSTFIFYGVEYFCRWNVTFW